jgi:hypothetical protein
MAICSCITTSGKQCSRDASIKSNSNTLYCWQHQKCQNKSSTLQALNQPIIVGQPKKTVAKKQTYDLNKIDDATAIEIINKCFGYFESKYGTLLPNDYISANQTWFGLKFKDLLILVKAHDKDEACFILWLSNYYIDLNVCKLLKPKTLNRKLKDLINYADDMEEDIGKSSNISAITIPEILSIIRYVHDKHTEESETPQAQSYSSGHHPQSYKNWWKFAIQLTDGQKLNTNNPKLKYLNEKPIITLQSLEKYFLKTIK